MTKVTSLERVKIRLEIPLEDTSQDDQLQLRLSDAEDFFKMYCRRSDIPLRAAGLIERLAVLFYQERSGVQSEKIGDTSVTFRTDQMPLEMKRELNRYRRIAAR